MQLIKQKLHYLKCEFIYLIGGIPREHINTVNYRNIKNIFENIKQQIEEANTQNTV